MALLNETESHSAVWVKVRTHMEERLDKLRRRNDQNLGVEDTARLRGEIASLKALLELDKPTPAIQADADFE